MWKKLGNSLYIFLISLFTTSCSFNLNNDFINIKIKNIYDGDTFTDIENIRYRLFGVDTPEMKEEDGTNTKGIIHAFAKRARNFSQYLISRSKTIKIKKISEDKYQRKVIKLFINDKDLGKELISNGLAIVRYISLDVKNPFFTKDKIYYKELLDLEIEARNKKIGIWSLDGKYDFIKKTIFRQT